MDATAGRHDRVQVKNILALLAATFSVGSLLIGCQSTKPAFRSPTSPAQATRNNCYSLLHQLLDDQKDVSMLRFIKREHSDLKALITKIATTSGTGSKLLEEFAKKDPSLNLDAILLPLGETATRDAIASTKKSELLSQTGDGFELTLLLTQTEALSYAWHLAKVGSENDSQPDRAQALAAVSEDMKNLYQEVFAMLLSKTKSSAMNQTTAKTQSWFAGGQGEQRSGEN
jgi:hypothetical protein